MAFDFYDALFSIICCHMFEEGTHDVESIKIYFRLQQEKILFRFVANPQKSEDIIGKVIDAPPKNGYILNLIKEGIRPSVLKLGEIKKILKGVLGNHGITKIYLFGSYARGDANPSSDIDIQRDKGNIKTLIEQGELEDELKNNLGKRWTWFSPLLIRPIILDNKWKPTRLSYADWLNEQISLKRGLFSILSFRITLRRLRV